MLSAMRSIYLPGCVLGTVAGLGFTPAAASDFAHQLDRINVTATRTARTADQTLASVTVITREEITASQATDISELLNGLPGIEFNSHGGYGATTTLHLRGTNAGHVLVLIDGIRVGSVSIGSTAWEHLPISQIARVEVVRGPLSHLYGSDAIGGVVQIFTIHGEKGERISGSASIGSHNTFKGELGISGGTDTTSYSLQLTHLQSEGYNATVGNDPDKDGYDNTSISASLGHRLDNGLTLKLSGLLAKGNNEFDGFDTTKKYDADFEQQLLTGSLEYAPADWWGMSLRVGESRDLSTNFVDGHHDSEFETRRPQVVWQNDFYIGDQDILTAGVDYLRDEVKGTTEYAKSSRENSALFGQYQFQLGSGDITLGLRYDDNQSFGGHTTGNIAWGYPMAPGLRFNASYGTAFKAPTFNDLYYQDPWGSNGNPDLDPEESESLELGLEGDGAWGGWSLRAYRTEIDDLIQWVEIAPFSWQPNNVAKARIDGFEASLNTRIDGWLFQLSATWLDPVDRESGNLLPSRSKRSLRLDLERAFGATTFGATFGARSESYDDQENTRRNPGYGTLDLRLDQRLSADWLLQAKIDNLFDHDYQTRNGYYEPGRLFFLGLRYQPE